MHRDDAGMAERGDMFVNRKKPNVLIRAPRPYLLGVWASERFTPDVLLDDGDDLSPYGLEGTVSCLPGHSKGSIGVLTAGGELFCGDLFDNTKGPAFNSLLMIPRPGGQCREAGRPEDRDCLSRARPALRDGSCSRRARPRAA